MRAMFHMTASYALLLAGGFALSACSPYAYENEVETFSAGVDASVQAFEALTPQYTAWAIQERNKELLNDFKRNGTKPFASEGCENLRAKYDEAFAEARAPDKSLLTAADFAACRVTPVPRTDPGKGLPNLTALGKVLTSYAAGLAAITNAKDEAALQDAVGQINGSALTLLAAVNHELTRKEEPILDAVGALVYQVGLDYLRQRRFDALKNSVNENTAVVSRAADLLAEAAFDIYGPTLTAKSISLNQAENHAVSTDAKSFLENWSQIDEARDVYVKAFADSPIYAFANISATHMALRDSLNDPGNQAELKALYVNVVALKKAADAAFKAIEAKAPAIQ